ncbi:beta-galactosidase-1-like protein 3 [Diceros bicornis minor]|uniref:beta-galactosidase-1-like protein 3 n=1 Tax=Diceros bicornis minor TaxID=77932 RepID=UPI0026F1309E|nr:beta-galactosidase-1-like protein 3 [Diceros bicornis minor]
MAGEHSSRSSSSMAAAPPHDVRKRCLEPKGHSLKLLNRRNQNFPALGPEPETFSLRRPAAPAPSPGPRLLRFTGMGSPPRSSPCLSWKRILCIFFLPFILSGFPPRVKHKKNLISGNAWPQPLQFNWSHLTPLELKDRSVGLQTQSTVGSNPYFTLEGDKFLILGGSIHYFRVPREYWRDRLLKLKACGFNTVTTYVPWNLHEPERGRFDFSGNLDLEAFVLTAAEIGLWVILRPGPYICSEIDLGGLPSWLLQDPKLKLRTTDKGFIEAVDKYFDHLISRVVPLQYRKGGPIIAVQVENEYGSFDKDKDYMPYVEKALLKRGIVELPLTSDNTKDVVKGSIKGVLATINMKTFQKDAFQRLYKVQSNKPIMIMEYWVGWFDTWGSKHVVRDADDVEKTVSEFIKFEISFNVYMFHGGTNFGFINGATNFVKHSGVVTSYDYDAVLTEAGDYTEKYFKLRKLFGSILAIPLPPLPALTPKAVYPSMRSSLYLPLWDVLQYLNEPVISNIPVNMENLPINNGNGQSYGLVLYETSICSGGQLHADVHDTAQVFLNETRIGILYDNTQNLNIPEVRECQLLRILVENQGRVNFSWKIQNQRKGLTGSVTINNVPLEGFTIYSLEMKMSFFKRLRSATWRPVPNSYSGPAFYLATLKAGSSPKDTFLRLLSWNYGFVFINGRNLGRYWIIGPQETLYLPGAWLHPEDNEIILFEKIKSGSDIETTDQPKL